MLQFQDDRAIVNSTLSIPGNLNTERLTNKEDGMRKGSSLLLLFVICVPAKAQQAGDQEGNKKIARSFFEEVLDKGRFDRYAESHAKDFVAHGGDHDATLEEDIAEAK